MLVLTRRIGEEIVIGDDIVLKVLEVQGRKVRLGLTVPRDVAVLRQEICDRRTAVGDADEPSGLMRELILCAN